ncbi:unnamed protein product [Auanema sp. JU1783]|nr:unnamed protein product [Auanema sp. JU1783]
MIIKPRLQTHVKSYLIASLRWINVLGIETSCDDTAVAIINDRKKVYSALRYTNRDEQREKGGICPASVAIQHREKLPNLVSKCMRESGLSYEEIDAIAVTTKPGLVIALKEGIKTAIEVARAQKKPLIPVHHMRAHALSGFLCSESLQFPFLCLLISGGHSLIVLVKQAEDFEILGQSLSGSAGECLDKIARELNVQSMEGCENIHPGAGLELVAKKASADGYLRYAVGLPSTPRADMNFSQLKSSFLNLIKRKKDSDDFSVEDFCSSAQHFVARHIISKLNAAFDHLNSTGEIKSLRHLVISGGVASNMYINNGIRKLCSHYNIEHIPVPPHLCTDNAEMIAWTGTLMMKEKSRDIYKSSDIPDLIYAHAKYEIGNDVRDKLPKKTFNKLSGYTIHDDLPLKFFNSDMFKSRS